MHIYIHLNAWNKERKANVQKCKCVNSKGQSDGKCLLLELKRGKDFVQQPHALTRKVPVCSGVTKPCLVHLSAPRQAAYIISNSIQSTRGNRESQSIPWHNEDCMQMKSNLFSASCERLGKTCFLQFCFWDGGCFYNHFSSFNHGREEHEQWVWHTKLGLGVDDREHPPCRSLLLGWVHGLSAWLFGSVVTYHQIALKSPLVPHQGNAMSSWQETHMKTGLWYVTSVFLLGLLKWNPFMLTNASIGRVLLNDRTKRKD